MLGYNKKMLKIVKQKNNEQAYPYPMPKALASGGMPSPMKQEMANQAYQSSSGLGTPTQGSYGGYQSGGYQGSPYSPYARPMKKGTKSPASFSHKSPSLATDLHCYFQCPETFKKDFDLRLHLKLRHKNEDPNELRKAEAAAEDEISFTRRSGSKFQCAICPKSYESDSTMGWHAKQAHGMTWTDYKEKYGRCEVESAPFECKICGSVIKYTPNVVHSHIKQVHGIDWLQYLDRIRKMARGEEPEPLPQIERFSCGICNNSVKFLKEHIWQVHKLTELEYETRLQQMQRGIVPDPLPMIDVFDCQICGSTVKNLYDHVWRVHRLVETDYTERIAKLSRGEDPGPLPSIETTECKICNMSAKGFREHLRRVHKITVAEYEELFNN